MHDTRTEPNRWDELAIEYAIESARKAVAEINAVPGVSRTTRSPSGTW